MSGNDDPYTEQSAEAGHPLPADAVASLWTDEATLAERARAEAWILAQPGEAAHIRAAWDLSGVITHPANVDEAWAALSARVATTATSPTPRITLAPSRSRSRFRWAPIGAALVILIVLGVATTSILRQTTSEKHRPSSTTYATRAGERATVTLADGSRVTLGPATTLRVQPSHNVQDPLTIDVVGDALFTVAHVAQRPFAVTAHGVTTRVLGTSFAVRAYSAGDVRVAVQSGRVSVQSPALTANNAVIVAAGQVASITPNAMPVVARVIDPASEFDWATGTLVLDDVPLGDAIVRLSRWYGREFRVADAALLVRRVNGVFPDTLNPGRIQSLANVMGARVIRTATTITFTTAR